MTVRLAKIIYIEKYPEAAIMNLYESRFKLVIQEFQTMRKLFKF